jgi:4'-phosphopantetheinyl transferase
MDGCVTIKEIEIDGHNIMLALVDIASLRAKDMDEIHPLLTPGEKVQFHSFKIEKRRWEWLAGRLGIKLLVCDVYNSEPNDVDVEPNWTRKPFARINELQIDACISITHSNDLAVCGLVKEAKMGLDLEHVEERSMGMLEEAFSEEEREMLSEPIDWEEVTLHWTRKEAVAKALGIGLGLSLHDINSVGQVEVGLSARSCWRLCLEPGKRFTTHNVNLENKWSDDYILNMCVLEDGSTLHGLLDVPDEELVGGLLDDQ